MRTFTYALAMCLMILTACGDSNNSTGSSNTTNPTTIPTTQPGTATNLQATVQPNPRAVLLTWQYQGTAGVSFAIYRAATADQLATGKLNVSVLLEVTNDIFFTDTTAQPGQTYVYRVVPFLENTFGTASNLVLIIFNIGQTGTVVTPPPGDGGAPSEPPPVNRPPVNRPPGNRPPDNRPPGTPNPPTTPTNPVTGPVTTATMKW